MNPGIADTLQRTRAGVGGGGSGGGGGTMRERGV